MDWLRVRLRPGSSRHDSDLHPGHPVLHGQRSAVPRAVQMKVSVNWLREYIELPPNIDELASLLTMAGIEVEGIETTGCNVPNVVVAQINSSEQHPNADRLSVCQVDEGSGNARQIVCGAKNYKVGD